MHVFQNLTCGMVSLALWQFLTLVHVLKTDLIFMVLRILLDVVVDFPLLTILRLILPAMSSRWVASYSRLLALYLIKAFGSDYVRFYFTLIAVIQLVNR